jgi:hypothetical protein
MKLANRVYLKADEEEFKREQLKEQQRRKERFDNRYQYLPKLDQEILKSYDEAIVHRKEKIEVGKEEIRHL